MKKPLNFFILFLGILALVFFCGCEEEKYYPEYVTIYVHGIDQELTTVELNTWTIYRHDFSAPEKEGYEFAGYYNIPDDDEIVGESGTQLTYPNGEPISSGTSNRIVDMLASNEPVEGKSELHIYAHYTPKTYSFVYKLGSADSAYDREDGKLLMDSVLYSDYASIDVAATPLPPIVQKEGYELSGWSTADGAVRVLDENGELLYSEKETYYLLLDYVDEYFFDHRQIFLTPVFSLPFSTVTFDYGISSLKNPKEQLPDGTSLTELTYPDLVYHNGKYLLGWSTEKGTLTPPDGAIDSDMTLYAIFTDAIFIQVSNDGGEAVGGYLLASGEIVVPTPIGYETYEITALYTDAGMTVPVTPTLQNTEEGTTLYAKWTKVAKKITLNPNNGDAPFTALIYQNPNKNNFTLPGWEGYEIEGWYTTRDFTGDPVELSFDQVEEDQIYYAKWQKI